MDRADALAACSHCPGFCAPACVATRVLRRDLATPKQRMGLAALAFDGRLDDEARLWLAACTRCDACTQACALEVPVADVVEAALAEGPAPRGLADVEATLPDELHRWRELGRLEGHAVVLLDMQTDLSPGTLEAWLTARESLPTRVLAGLDVGARLLAAGRWSAFEQLAEAIDAALRTVRYVAVATGDGLRALQRMQAMGKLRQPYVTLLDTWLARFGLPTGASAVPLPACRGASHAGPTAQVPGSAVWPPSPNCCGAAEPFASVWPDAARVAADDLVATLVRQGHRCVHVADLRCATWLRAAVERQDAELQIVHRLDRLTNG